MYYEEILNKVKIAYKKCVFCGDESIDKLCNICKDAYKLATSDRAWFKRVEEDHIKYALSVGVGRRHASCTFENYVSEKKLSSNWDYKENLLIQSTKAGNGKTHLSVAYLKEWVKMQGATIGRPAVLFTSFTELMRSIRATFGDDNASEADAIKQLCEVDLLIIDDIGAEKVTDFVQATIYTVLNRRYEDCVPTIATTNLDSQEMSELYGSRMVSRLASGSIVRVNGNDDRVKKQYEREIPSTKTKRAEIGYKNQIKSSGFNISNSQEVREMAAKMYTDNFELSE